MRQMTILTRKVTPPNHKSNPVIGLINIAEPYTSHSKPYIHASEKPESVYSL